MDAGNNPPALRRPQGYYWLSFDGDAWEPGLYDPPADQWYILGRLDPVVIRPCDVVGPACIPPQDKENGS